MRKNDHNRLLSVLLIFSLLLSSMSFAYAQEDVLETRQPTYIEITEPPEKGKFKTSETS